MFRFLGVYNNNMYTTIEVQNALYYNATRVVPLLGRNDKGKNTVMYAMYTMQKVQPNLIICHVIISWVTLFIFSRYSIQLMS